MATGRTLHVRCATWEQVEAFHTRKLRRGRLLSMKVPFQAQNGAQVTLGLELPDGVVIAIDGTVLKASPIEGDAKTWIEVELVGFTDEVTQRIRALAKSAETVKPAPSPPPPPPPPIKPRASTRDVGEDKPSDERALFTQLSAELKRLRAQPVHEVLGVSRDADADAVRLAWMNLVRKHHPDLVARHGAPAITHLAEELTILLNRAYDRLRAALVAEGRATTIGSTLQHPSGWLVGFEDLSSVDGTPVKARTSTTSTRGPAPPQGVPAQPRTSTHPANMQGGEAFEQRARAMLQQGDANDAQEVLAAALVVYPRSKPLRSLYYVASAMAALYKGETMLATSQLETALAHHSGCREAAAILDEIRKSGEVRPDELRGVFA